MSYSKMLVTRELFLQALGLPMTTMIIGAKVEYPYIYIEFVVDHPDIPEDSATVTPQFVSDHADCGHVERVTMVDWGSRP